MKRHQISFDTTKTSFDTNWSDHELNSKCLLLLAMPGSPSALRVKRIFQTICSFVKSNLPPRRPTMIRRIGVREHNLCRVLVFPMPPRMKSFTIEFWMRPHLANSKTNTRFFHLDFQDKSSDSSFWIRLNDVYPARIISESDIPYTGWLHFSLSFRVQKAIGSQQDILSLCGVVSRTTTRKKLKQSMECITMKRYHNGTIPSRFILASPAMGGGSYSDVRLWAFAFHHDEKSSLELRSRCQGRLRGNENWLLHYWPLDEVSGSVARNICSDKRSSEALDSFAKSHKEQKDLIEKYKVFIELTAANRSEDSCARFGHFKSDKDEFVLSKSVPAFVNVDGPEGATMFALAYLFRHPTAIPKNKRIRQGCLRLSKKTRCENKANPLHLKDSVWRVFCDEKVMTLTGLVTVKYVVDVDIKKCGYCADTRHFPIPGIVVQPSCQIGFLDPTSLKVIRKTETYKLEDLSVNFLEEYCKNHTEKDTSSRFPSREFPRLFPGPVMGRPLLLHDDNPAISSTSESCSSCCVSSSSSSIDGSDYASWSYNFIGDDVTSH